MCIYFTIAKLLFIFTHCVVILSHYVYPYSALRMEASSCSDPSVLTYQTTRCHNAEAQNMNTDCSQSLSAIRYYTYIYNP